MEHQLGELNHLLNQAVKEKKFLQNEVTKLSLKNMELFEEKEMKVQKTPEDFQEIEMKVKKQMNFI